MASFLLSIAATCLFPAQLPPEEKVPTATPEPAPVTGEAVTDAERGRIEAMLQKYAASKLKGQKVDQQFRLRLVKETDPETGEPVPDDGAGPHEFGFHAVLPETPDAFEVKLLGAEVLGPKRYRLALTVTVPFDNLGGHYKFDGAAGILGSALGWIIDQISAKVQVYAVLDIGWKNLDNGALGLYPGGALDESLTEEERRSAPLFEDLRIDADNVDLSRVNLEGINRRRVFVQNGEAVGRGGLLRALGPGGRQRIEQMIEGGLNQAIRQNEPRFIEGINQMMQEQLPDTQIQVTSFIEKLAIQANLPGRKVARPPEPPKPNPPFPAKGSL